MDWEQLKSWDFRKNVRLKYWNMIIRTSLIIYSLATILDVRKICYIFDIENNKPWWPCTSNMKFTKNKIIF